MIDIALVQMPFGTTESPSLGLSLLKAGLSRSGITSKVLYLNRLFADLTGAAAYEPISRGEPQNIDLLGEWVFTEALWGANPARDASYFASVLWGGVSAHRKHLSDERIHCLAAHAWTCRKFASDFIDRCVTEIDWSEYRIVGFTSVFQQHVPALTLARLLKQRHPHLFIVFGGANCEGEMGLATLSAFRYVDAVCSGEGDIVFPRFARSVLNGSLCPSEGITLQSDLPTTQPVMPQDVESAIVRQMDDLPYPDFDDFFQQCWREDRRCTYRLMFETSRGCWWGQKHHCTFCGINDTGMLFRQKSPERAMGELKHLLNRYGEFTTSMTATDLILPHKYWTEFLPKLPELGVSLDLFYETKSNLRKDQILLYRDAGLREIQPGIENFSTDVLHLIDKGVSAIQNIQTLKLCLQFGILPHWNFMYGIPGERADFYHHQGELIAKISHLDPPGGVGKVRFDRFSPYLTSASKFGLRNISAYPAYDYIYPFFDSAAKNRLAYSFSADFPGSQDISPYGDSMEALIGRWKERWSATFLVMFEQEDRVLVLDGRVDPAVLWVVQGICAKVLIACEAIASAEQITKVVKDAGYSGAISVAVDEAIKILEADRLVICESGKFLCLPIYLGLGYRPSAAVIFRIEQEISVENAKVLGDACLL